MDGQDILRADHVRIAIGIHFGLSLRLLKKELRLFLRIGAGNDPRKNQNRLDPNREICFHLISPDPEKSWVGGRHVA
jgi:hypothetical protein